MENTITIQIRDVGGNWLSVQNTMTNDDRYIYSLMESAQSGYPGKQVRAVDQNGRIVDMIG